MKVCLALLAIVVSSISTFAQGTVDFRNSGLVTPIHTYPGTLMPAGGQAYSFQFVYGTSPDNLNFSSPIFYNSNTEEGKIGGAGLASVPVSVPDGTMTFFQMRAWSTSRGTFADVLADPTPYNQYTYYLSSVIVGIPRSLPFPAIPLFGTVQGSQFQGFTIYSVPEPSTITLGVLGFGLLLGVRHRQRK